MKTVPQPRKTSGSLPGSTPFRAQRSASNRKVTRQLADKPHRFGEVRQRGDEQTIVIPAITSENRDYLPCGLLPSGVIISNKCYGLFDAPLWNMALVRVTASLGLDRRGLCSVGNEVLLLQHPGLEHLPPCRRLPRKTGRT